MLQIGLVGVGLMGSGIATNLRAAGWPLGFLDHPGNQPTAALVRAGAVAHTSAADLAAASDVVILCVTGTPQVEDVLQRDGGVLAGLSPGATIVDCSTAIPASTLRLAAAVTARGGRFVDTPMTRTPKEAMEGRLNLLLGGDPGDVERVLPVLRAFAENITHVGPTGAGHRMKLLHNFVSLGFSAILAETAAAADQAGIDPAILHRVLEEGGGRGTVLDRFAPYLLDGDETAFRFTLANAAKDTGYYVDMQDTAAGPVARATAQLYASRVAAGHGDAFVPLLARLLADD